MLEYTNLFVYSISLIALIYVKSSIGLDYTYHNYNKLNLILKEYTIKHPTKTFLYSIGKTVENRDIWVLAISGKQPDSHVTLRPEVKYIGNIHGNERLGGELLLHFITLLLENPNQDPSVEYIMKSMRIHALISLNPDGVEKANLDSCDSELGQNNSNNFDLDRNFPDKFFCNRAAMQPETKAIINWLDTNTFVLSGKFQTGAIVASYPYENFKHSKTAQHGKNMPTDFDDVFVYLASRYSLNHKTMKSEICNGESFKDGITNGANRFPPVRGGMQDFNFWKFGCAEITLGISCCLNPPETQIKEIWEQNTKSLIELSKRANTGIRGLIEFKNHGPAKYLGVKFDSMEPIYKTNELGEYYALLLPNTYIMSIMLNCDVIYTTKIEIFSKSRLLILNVTLNEKEFEKSKTYKFDKYPLFCNRDNAPVECSEDGHDSSDSESDEDGENEAISNQKLQSATKTVGILISFQILIEFIKHNFY